MTNEVIKKLSEAALDVRKRAYCPYSGFAVGAALLAKSGEIYTGVNIENAAFTPTNCAERTAFFTAIAKGERDFVAVAIAGGKAGEEPEDFCAPCGVCRQVMREFCGDAFAIDLVVKRMSVTVLNSNNDCFIHLIADDLADSCLSHVSFAHV